jgi:RHS repeat-associated protein
VRLVVNATTGAVEQRLDYDSFGVVLTDTNPGFQPFGFGGGLYDPDTGLVALGVRDYDAETGRFTAPDPIGLAGFDTNLYRYVHDDPVNAVDPSGFNDFIRNLLNDSVDDPIDLYAGVLEGLLDTVVVGAGSIAVPIAGPLPFLYYVATHPILETVQSTLDIEFIDTQGDVFKFGNFVGGAICPEGALASDATTLAKPKVLEKAAEEVTQIVRQRKVYRPFAQKGSFEVISASEGQTKVGELIDAAFDQFPFGKPLR